MKDIFTQVQQLKKWLIAMILVNLTILGILFFVASHNGKPHPDPSHLAAVLKEELSLTEKQTGELVSIRQNFFKLEEPLSLMIRSQRDSMNIYMFRDDADTLFVREIAGRIAQNEYQMELGRLRQSVALRNILTPQQRLKLSALMKDIKNYFKPEKRK